MKKYLTVAGILGLICLICAGLIAVMNMVTSPIKASNEEATKKDTYSKIFEDYNSKSNSITDFEDSCIEEKFEAFDAAGNSIGYIYTVKGSNAYGTIELMVGIKNNQVVDVEFLKNTESFASTVKSHVKANYPSSKENVVEVNIYGAKEEADVSALDSLDNIDVKCGATYGAKLVKELVNAALNDAKEVK